MMSQDFLDYPLSWQSDQWQILQQQRTANRLAHAYLLAGDRSECQKKFAEHFAKGLLCEAPQLSGDPCRHCVACHQFSIQTHPDFLLLLPEGKQFKIDQIRALLAQTMTTASRGGYRVVIIASAEQMNRAASHALLKWLEEPPDKTLIFLVTAHCSRLLSTIISRCILLKFQPPLCTEEGSEALSLEREQWLRYFLSVLNRETPPLSITLDDKGALSRRLQWMQIGIADCIKLKMGAEKTSLCYGEHEEIIVKTAAARSLKHLFGVERLLLEAKDLSEQGVPLNESLLMEQVLIRSTYLESE